MHHDFPEPLCQKTSVGDKCIQIGTHGDGLSAETEEMAISPGAPQSWTPGACPADYGISCTPRATRRLLASTLHSSLGRCLRSYLCGCTAWAIVASHSCETDEFTLPAGALDYGVHILSKATGK